MKNFFIILILLFIGCVSDNLSVSDVSLNDAVVSQDLEVEKDHTTSQEIWICYNPKSENHDKACSDLCHFPINENSFCWLLSSEDCPPQFVWEWQEKFCPLLD